MNTCAACGHELGLGRFCTNCGEPVATSETGSDWRTDTAERLVPRRASSPQERPAPPPVVPGPARVPPSAVTPPPPPRYPLFADELEPGPVASATPEPSDAAAPFLVVDRQVDVPQRRSWLSWLAALLAALALLAVGVYALWAFVLDEDDAPAGAEAAESPVETSDGPTPVDVASTASALAPDTAPPNEDVDGQLVSYDASNMLDGVTETAWRTAGDATGMRLTFQLAEPTRLTEVGILNGYAKRSTDPAGKVFDWYRGNRRVEAVVWQLGQGTTVRQELVADRSVQTLAIEPVTTRRVVLRLVQVSAPGTGRAGRDYTAISEISLVGLPR